MLNTSGLQHTVITAASGTKIPALGLGTFEPDTEGGDRCRTAVKEGILAGYRHIDTASFYGCEKEVGQGIKDSGVPREELYVCTKFWQQFHAPDDVAKSLEESLARMQLDYVDLYLMHWPLAFKRTEDYEVLLNAQGKPVVDEELSTNHEPTWRAMEALVRPGKARAIGVSNFTKEQFEKLLSFAEIKPSCNQVEAHPWFPQNELLQFCKDKGIVFIAFSPLGSQEGSMNVVKARLLDDQSVAAVAKKNDIAPAQVLISWALQRGTVAVPKSANPVRIKANFQVPRLSDEDFKTIDEIVIRDPSKLNRFINFDGLWDTEALHTFFTGAIAVVASKVVARKLEFIFRRRSNETILDADVPELEAHLSG